MPKPKRHIFVCRNYRDASAKKPSCEARGAADIFKAFKELCAQAGISEETRLTKVWCFGKCEHGPNAVVYPDNVWYCGLKVDDVKNIVESHLLNDRPVKEKQLDDDLI